MSPYIIPFESTHRTLKEICVSLNRGELKFNFFHSYEGVITIHLTEKEKIEAANYVDRILMGLKPHDVFLSNGMILDIPANKGIKYLLGFVNNNVQLRGDFIPDLDGKFYRDLEPVVAHHIAGLFIDCLENRDTEKQDLFVMVHGRKMTAESLNYRSLGCHIVPKNCRQLKNSEITLRTDMSVDIDDKYDFWSGISVSGMPVSDYVQGYAVIRPLLYPN